MVAHHVHCLLNSNRFNEIHLFFQHPRAMPISLFYLSISIVISLIFSSYCNILTGPLQLLYTDSLDETENMTHNVVNIYAWHTKRYQQIYTSNVHNNRNWNAHNVEWRTQCYLKDRNRTCNRLGDWEKSDQQTQAR